MSDASNSHRRLSDGWLSVKMSNSLKDIHIKPEYMMVYCNTIRPCIVASEYMKLMCIIPLRPTQENVDTGYITEEFAKPEAHEIESSLVKSVKMSLRTHWGTGISLPAGKKVFINLLFFKDE